MTAAVVLFPSAASAIVDQTVRDVGRGYDRRTRVLRALRLARQRWEAMGVSGPAVEADLAALRARIEEQLDSIEREAAALAAEIEADLAFLDGLPPPRRPRGPGGGRAA